MRFNLLGSRQTAKVRARAKQRTRAPMLINLIHAAPRIFTQPPDSRVSRTRASRPIPALFLGYRSRHPRVYWRVLRPLELGRARVSDRRTWPRCWWFPVYHAVLFTNDVDRLKYHDETSRALRRSVFTLVAYCMFCLLTLSTPDAQVLSATASVRVPFANVDVGFANFLFVGPLVLIGLLVYQHIYVAHLRLTDPPPPQSQLPILFNLPYRSARVISAFLFYWIGPLVLIVFMRKALPRPGAIFLVLMAGLTLMWTLLLQIRRCPSDRRRLYVPALFCVIALAASICAEKMILVASGHRVADTLLNGSTIGRAIFSSPFERRLNLGHVILDGQDLRGFDLTGANLRGARLRGATLIGARLDNSDLSDADLTGADLRKASLSKTRLSGTNLFNARRQ